MSHLYKAYRICLKVASACMWTVYTVFYCFDIVLYIVTGTSAAGKSRQGAGKFLYQFMTSDQTFAVKIVLLFITFWKM